MPDEKMARLRREAEEATRLREERKLREATISVLRRCALLLRECHLYRGYTDGPAHQPAVPITYRQAEALLAELEK